MGFWGLSVCTIYTYMYCYFDLNQILKVLLRIQNLYPDYVEEEQQCLHQMASNYGVRCPF